MQQHETPREKILQLYIIILYMMKILKWPNLPPKQQQKQQQLYLPHLNFTWINLTIKLQ